MAFLTSYIYGGVELNDGLYYAIPSEGTNLDDLNVAEESFMYIPGGDLPISTGITMKEGTLVLNINIIANTATLFEARLDLLKTIFNTAVTTYGQLQRKLPFQQSYSYLEVAPRQFSVDRQQHKVSVTFSCINRAWKGTTNYSAEVNAFYTGNRTEHISVAYAGKLPYEPVIEITAQTAGSDGPVPLYFVNATVYASGAQHILNTPILLKDYWDTLAHVTAGRMRSDGLDVTVSLPNGTKLDRFINGTAQYRRLWIKPQTWPTLPARVSLQGGSVLGSTNASATTIPIVAAPGTLVGMPTSGKVNIGDEIIAYTGLTITSADNRYGQLTGCTRGQSGTSAQSFVNCDYWAVKFPTVLTIAFGYASGYAGTYFANNTDAWPLIDLDASNNSVWIQRAATTSPGVGYFTGRPLSWRAYSWLPFGPTDHVEGTYSGVPEQGNAHAALTAQKNIYLANSYRERLVMQLLPYTSRRTTSARLLYTLSAGDTGQFPLTSATFAVTRENYSNTYQPAYPGFTTSERYVDLITQTQASGSAQKDTGWQTISQDWWGATHMHIGIRIAPQNSVKAIKLVLDEVQLLLDGYFQESPKCVIDTTLHGYGVDTFPVVLTVRNATDTANPTPFSIWPMMDENGVANYDCATYAVTGALLSACSYQNPHWLRLLPGTNDIVVTGVTGIGHTKVKIKWMNNN